MKFTFKQQQSSKKSSPLLVAEIQTFMEDRCIRKKIDSFSNYAEFEDQTCFL